MGKRGIDVKALVKLMAFYGLATYLVIIVSFNLPFLMEEYGLSSGRAGILISLFFLAIMAPGFVLNKIVQMLGRRIYMICLLLIACGMGIILVSRSEILIALGCILNGLAYGIIQPLIYDKTSDVAVPHKGDIGTCLCDGDELCGYSSLSVYCEYSPESVSFPFVYLCFLVEPDDCVNGNVYCDETGKIGTLSTYESF